MTPLGRLTFQHMLYLQALVEERHVTRRGARRHRTARHVGGARPAAQDLP